MTPDTPSFTASITKLYIAATVMRMVEEGELALGDRMVDHLLSSTSPCAPVYRDRHPSWFGLGMAHGAPCPSEGASTG